MCHYKPLLSDFLQLRAKTQTYIQAFLPGGVKEDIKGLNQVIMFSARQGQFASEQNTIHILYTVNYK